MLDRSLSQAHYEKLCRLIPGGVNSPVRSCKEMGQLPLVADHAYQDLLVDADGNTFIDYCGSWGALIHGHANPQILEALGDRMKKGTSFGVTTALEGELAQEIINLIDSVEKIRFVSSGTEATMSAVRLARGYTGKEIVVKFSGNYHGHADFFLVQAGSGVLNVASTSSSAGIPEEVVKHTFCLPYNDVEACRQLFYHPEFRHRIAAVIVEPVAGNMGVVPAEIPFLQFLRDETEKMGAILIFDEVMSGFRVAKRGAQELYGIQPDLTCFGKIVGGGLPAAAFGGKEEIMDQLAPLGPVYQAGTLSGNPLAMEAGLQSIRLLQREGFYEELKNKTSMLVDPINELIKEKKLNVCIQQAGSMFTLFFGMKQVRNLEDTKQCDTALFAHFFRTLFEQGIYIPPSQYEAWFISQAHTEVHLKKTRDAVLSFLNVL